MTRPDIGFAGLRTLVSDVEAALRETEKRSQARPASAATPMSSAPAAPEKSFRWGRLFLAIVGVGFLTRCITDSTQSSSTPAVPAYSPQPATAPAPGANPLLQEITSAPNALYERRPIEGGRERTLDLPELRYCLAEEIRLAGADSVVDANDQSEINRFNALVDSYNNACGAYHYRRGTLESARREVEPFRSKLLSEGRARLGR